MLSKKIGIDLGTSTVLVYVKGEGIVLNEPSVVATNEKGDRILAVGREAAEMLGRTPGSIHAIRPMREGVIADYVVTEGMLHHFIARVCGRQRIFKPDIMICVPSGVTGVERRAVLEATMQAGAKTAYLIEEPLAAAIGANLPISTPTGNMICDIGGGTSEIAVISLGGMVVANSIRVGGNKFDDAIVGHIKKRHNLMVGDRTAEDIKMQIGSAMPLQEELTMSVRGRDMVAGLPKNIVITSQEITEAIQDQLASIVQAIRVVLEQTPPELSADIYDKGIVLSGGGALLRNIDRYVSYHTGVPAIIAENPQTCVATGTGLALENLDVLKRNLLYIK
ncbi:MAG: rod shape-determining protein MreB [Candidatus Dormibacteria bacterium]